LRDLLAIKTDYVIIHKDLLDVNEVKAYEKYRFLYKKGEIYNKNNIIIIDLKRYGFALNKCDFNKDFDKDLELASIKNTDKNSFILLLKNKSDCYLSNIYLDKYKKENFLMKTLYGEQINRTVYFKLPVLIEPFEKVTLTEIGNQLRVE
jgi:hypothetical protein